MRRRLLSPLVAGLSAGLVAAAPAQQVPEHLQRIVDDLPPVEIPVLAPPDRPPGTSAALIEGDGLFYRLLFTNDPGGELSHAEQVNVFVSGRAEPLQPPPDALPVEVRGTEGVFFCGASACFLDWEESGASYSVGEFGSPGQAVGFAESLEPIEELVEAAEPEPPPAAEETSEEEEGLPGGLVLVLVLGAGLLAAAGVAAAVRGRRG